VLFYVLAPLLARVFARPSGAARATALGAGLALGSTLTCLLTMTEGIPQPCKLTLACYVQYFLMGFALADWYARWGDRGDRSRAADALAIPCLVAVPLLEQHPVLRAYLLPLACGGLCFSALHGRIHARLMSVPALVVIGGMCYTIYLYHPYIKSVFGPFLVRMTPQGLPAAVTLLGQLAAFIAVIVALCVPLFLCFEKPFMAMGARKTG
jgi:peptidoglycan/LPS O-acetylase OafA/YrhL